MTINMEGRGFVSCPSCHSNSVTKHGCDGYGNKRYACHCGTRFRDTPTGVIPEVPRKKCKPKPAAKPQPPARVVERRKVTLAEADHLYVSMLGQKPGKPNIPMLDRSRELMKLFGRVAEILEDLRDLDPKTAASQVSDPMELRTYSGSRGLGEWWMKFADACEVRRSAEHPELGSQPRLSAVKWRRLNG